MPNPLSQPPASATKAQTDWGAVNRNYRSAVVRGALKITQQLQTIAVNPANQTVVNFTPRNVGLLLGFIVSVSGAMTTTGGTTMNRTQFGGANFLSNITFNDFDNYQRISCPGWYLNVINSIKNRQMFGSAFTITSAYANYGSNFTVSNAPATITTGPTTFQQVYYVPVAYSEWDLRGAMFAAVTGVQANLALTINPTPWVAAGDATLSMYSGGTGGAYSGNVTLDVYQVFYDQLPQVKGPNGNAVLAVPPLDVATTYELHNTANTGLVANQENTIAFSNYRQFLSTTAIYNNNGVLNAGSDVNYWALQAANLLNIFRIEPFVAALNVRSEIGTDLPNGTYYFSTRDKPIDTQVYGNLNLVLNPSAVTAGASVLVGYETFARRNTVLSAQAFPSAG